MERVNNKVMGKEVEMVPQISDEELDRAKEEALNEKEAEALNEKEAGEDPLIKDAEIIEEEKIEVIPPIPLLEQLKTHVGELDGKTVLGYSVLFNDSSTEEVSTDTTIANYGMVTSYPQLLNHLLLGYHANMISNEEVGIIEVMAHTIAGRLTEMQKRLKEAEVKIVEDEGKDNKV